MIKYSTVLFAPTADPVTLQEAKDQLYITSTDRDTVITRLITVATRMCEKYSGLSFMTQTRVVKLDSFPYGHITLDYGPVQAISGNDAATPTPNDLGLTYVDGDGDTQTLVLNTNFLLDSHSGIPRLSFIDNWPTDYDTDIINPITITYSAGYASAALVPAEAKQAILTQVAYMHENPEGGASGLCVAAMDYLDMIKVYYYASQD
jgi:uncharacterized phiE125 gp8 family phage protein